MVETQDIMDILETLGLNSYERKLYLALLNKGTSSAGKLSELAGVPRSRTYDVLESLADKGFAIIKSTKPIEYVAVEPEEALERTKRRHEEDYKEMANRVDKLKQSDVLKEMKRIHDGSMETLEPGEVTGTLKGRRAMMDQLETMLKNAEDEAHFLLSEEGLKELYSKHGTLLQKAAKRGVNIRIAAPLNQSLHDIVDNLSSFAEIRDTKKAKGLHNLAGRFALVDDNELLFALTHDQKVHPTQDMSFWSKSNHATDQVLKPLFNMYWDQLE
ncbi:MAG: TrmB family transcriptional regulator [Candidatus Aenigmatarchaeota archaeon]